MSNQEYHTIAGVVLDKENNPVEMVWVRIYRENIEIDRNLTSTDGRYQIEFDRGSPITLIRYDHLITDGFTRRHPAIVTNISGERNHNINKVMPDEVGRGYDQHALLEMLSAYEYLYVIDTAIHGDASIRSGVRHEIIQRYRDNLSMIKHVDLITEQRHKQVLELYRNWQHEAEQSIQTDNSSSEQFSHEVTRDEPYYTTSPAQAKPPDGTFKAGTKVTLTEDGGSYSQVVSEDGIAAYVATDALKPI